MAPSLLLSLGHNPRLGGHSSKYLVTVNGAWGGAPAARRFLQQKSSDFNPILITFHTF